MRYDAFACPNLLASISTRIASKKKKGVVPLFSPSILGGIHHF